MQENALKKCTKGTLLFGLPAADENIVQEVNKRCKKVYIQFSPEKVLQAFKDEVPKIVLCSYSHENIRYKDVLKEIVKLREDLELIIIVGHKDREDVKEILNLKASKYLHEDVGKEEIIKSIQKIITNIQNAEKNRADAQYYKALIDNSIVSKSDAEGNITYVNDNFVKVTGFTREECYGKNHNILRHFANGNEIYEDMWSTIKKGKIWRERVLNKNKDNSDFWAETTIIPLRDSESGEIVEYVAIRRDITSLLNMKRKIIKQENDAKEQNKISEAKDSFLVLFTHELKTPLNAIINFTKYLLKHINADTIDKIALSKRRHLLEQIHESAEMMLGDVTNILDISRIKSHKLSYTLNSFSVKEAIEKVLQKHEALANENQVNITFQDDGSIPFITSDVTRYQQILANIISNAIKYSFGEVNIFLLSENEKVSVIVEDNGKGIEDKESVFELFEQSGKGLLKKEEKGTGIGLNFVRLLCDDLDLEYKLQDSEELGGVKFILSKNKKGK